MAQKAFGGQIAYDWELWIGRETTPGADDHTFTQIYGFEALPAPEQVPEDVDVTHMQSPGRTRETIPGLLPVGDWSQEKQYWPTDPGDILLEELSALTAEGDREIILVEFNFDPANGAIRRTYRSYVNSFIPTGSVGEKAMATVNVKMFDRQGTDPRVIV